MEYIWKIGADFGNGVPDGELGFAEGGELH
jgi:hypothetical protein